MAGTFDRDPSHHQQNRSELITRLKVTPQDNPTSERLVDARRALGHEDAAARTADVSIRVRLRPGKTWTPTVRSTGECIDICTGADVKALGANAVRRLLLRPQS